LGTASLSQLSNARRKRIAAMVAGALALAILTVAGAYWRGFARKEKPLPPAEPLPKNVDQQLSGYTYTRTEGERQVFTVHAARTVSFTQGGSTVLQDVLVEIFGPAGNRHDLLRTQQCEYNPSSGELFAGGDVKIELNNLGSNPPSAGPARAGRDPVLIETSKVHFTQQATIAETDQPVKFQTQHASGTSRGMTYSTKTGAVELLNDVFVNLPPRGGPKPMPEVNLTASRLRFDKEKRKVDLWGPIEITQAARRVFGGRGIIVLDDRNRVKQAFLQEGVRGVDKTPPRAMGINAETFRADFDPGNGNLRTVHAEGHVEGEMWRNDKVSRLSSQSLDMAFSGVHPQPLNGTASGNVKVTIQPAPGTTPSSQTPANKSSLADANQELTAAEIRFAFRPQQQSLQSAQTAGVGHVILVPTNPQSGSREIFAEPLVMEFDSKSRLETLRGLSHAKVTFHPSKLAPAGSLTQESTSDRLKATFDPETGELVAANQTGHFHFREGDRNATADQSDYAARTQLMTLIGSPRFWDTETRVHADRILVDQGKDTAEGVGHVQSTHLNLTNPGQGSDKPVPTNVVADRILAEKASQFVHYEGHVRSWHGLDVVESSALNVYKKERRVSTASRVLTSYIQAPQASSPGAAAHGDPKEGPNPITIGADGLDYSEDGRVATYCGNVILQTDNTTLRADRLVAYFSRTATAESSEIDHAVAAGNVSVVQPTRRTTGEHAEYFAAAEKIIMTGGPPSVYDAVNGLTTGRSLTLFIHDDTILVDGGEKSPTISKHRISR
jgi:LPS export ABC transporter protein LptC/lipopolysaccharide transport protein LptA